MSTCPSDARSPPVCMDAMRKQRIRETRVPWPMHPGHPACDDAEDERHGTVGGHTLAPGNGEARVIRDLVDVSSPTAEKLVLVMETVQTPPQLPCLRCFRLPTLDVWPARWTSTTLPHMAADSRWPIWNCVYSVASVETVASAHAMPLGWASSGASPRLTLVSHSRGLSPQFPIDRPLVYSFS